MYQKCLGLFWLLFLLPLTCCSGLKGPPKLHSQNRLMTGEKGDQIKLPCPISANPEPLFEWKKDGRPIDETWPRYLLRRHFLRIKSANEDDTGEFTCTGVNGFGQESFTFSLLIYDENLPPMEVQTPPSLTDVSPSSSPFVTKIGDSITFVCKVKGIPLPKITWSKDGVPLHKSGFKLHHQIKSILDSGIYSCIVTNPLAIVTHNFTVIVEEKSYEEPEILQTSNTTVTEGGNTTLQCLVRSFLLPEIQWLKLLTPSEVAALPRIARNSTLHRDGRTYRYISTPGSRVERENGTYMSKLFIEKASSLDGGVYVCVGATRTGYNYKEVHLSVIPGIRQTIDTSIDEEDSELNILLIILPIIAIIIIASVSLFICKTRRTTLEKPHQSCAQNTSVESEDPTSNTPLNSYKHSKGVTNLPPDIVYQDGSSYTTHLSNMGPINGSIRYPDPYIYPDNSYLEPNYSDPYLEPHESSQRIDSKPFEARGSDHSYARLTQSTQSSTSPLPPPPYAYQLPFSSSNTPQSHSLSLHSNHQSNSHFSYTSPHSHRDTKYVVHYNL